MPKVKAQRYTEATCESRLHDAGTLQNNVSRPSFTPNHPESQVQNRQVLILMRPSNLLEHQLSGQGRDICAWHRYLHITVL